MAAYFLSAGDSLKVWDSSTMSIVSCTTPLDFVSIVKAVWSPKADCIALSGFRKQCDFASIYSISVSRGIIGLPVDIFATDTKSLGTSGSRDSSSSKHVSRTLFAFGSNGQVLACASKEGLIDFYDRKSKKITKSLSSAFMGCEVTAVALSADDATLIIADTEGSVWFRAVSKEDSPVRVKGQLKAVLVFQHLPGNRHVLICGHESGAVSLLDTGKKEFTSPFQNISTHLAACKDIAFSATNPNIAASVGMDNQIIIYDMGLKKILNKIMCDSSLYSIVFLPSGNEILCGTSTGKILMYNLTKEKSPQKIFLEHNGPVVSLAVPPLSSKPIQNEPNTSTAVRPSYAALKASMPATDIRPAKRASVPESSCKDIKETTLRPVGKPSSDKATISAFTPATDIQPHRVHQGDVLMGSGDAVHSTPVNATLSPNITVRDVHANNMSSPANGNIEPADNVVSVKLPDNGIDPAFANQLDTIHKQIDSATMETRIAALDIQDLIHAYGKENLERLSESEKKIRKLQEDTSRNTALLELILGELTAIRQRMPYL